MIRLLPLIVILLSACAAPDHEKSDLTERIEATVVLPNEADPIEEYERYYALRPDGTVLGVYTTHSDVHRKAVAETCRTLNEQPFPCPTDGTKLRLVKSGESVWISDHLELPGTNGGGCALINIHYDPRSQRFLEVECNGPY